VGVLRAARRLVSWQSAVDLAAVAELSARRSREARDAGPRPDERASAEVAAALTLTGRSADMLMDLASGVARLENVAAALARGEIEVARAHVFVDELSALPRLQASVIACRNMQAAGELTTSRLRSVLRRAALAADPEAEQRRQREARRDGRVQAWAESSGNAAIAGRELPTSRALLADRHISALAQSLKAAGMTGTLDEVRAEVFLALLSGQSPESLLAPRLGQPQPANAAGTASAASRGADSGADDGESGSGLSWPAGPLGTLHLTMPLSAWLGLTDNAGHIGGHGPVDAWTCRELADTMTGRPGTSYCLTVTTPEGYPLGHACPKGPPPPPGRAPPPAGPAPGPPGPRPRPPGQCLRPPGQRPPRARRTDWPPHRWPGSPAFRWSGCRRVPVITRGRPRATGRGSCQAT
jgi:ribosomal protein L12E/L44/L45/RPP1/RPP2